MSAGATLLRLARSGVPVGAPDGPLAPPDDWDASLVAKWAEVCSAVAEGGRVPRLCADLIRLYVVTWHDAVSARQNVAEHGTVVPAPRTGMPMPNPYHRVARDAEARCAKLARDLGMTGRRG